MIDKIDVFQARCDWPDCQDLFEDGEYSIFFERDDLLGLIVDAGWLAGPRGLLYCDRHPTQTAGEGYWSATKHDPVNLRLLGPGQAPVGFEPTDQPVLLIDLDGIAVYVERVNQDGVY